METGKSKRYSKEQVCYLVGRGQVTNCSGRLYKDQVLLEGVGMELKNLPVQQVDGEMSRTDGLGRIKRGTSAADAMSQIQIVMVIVYDENAKEVCGYIVQNVGGAKKFVTKEECLRLAQAGRIGNARVNMSNGVPILRSANNDASLSSLPKRRASDVGLTIQYPGRQRS